MRRSFTLALALMFATGAAHATEQRDCTFTQALFPADPPEAVDLGVVIAANGASARIRVAGSGEWAAQRRANAAGGDVITFDTDAALETVTIAPDGQAQWDIAFRDPDIAAVYVSTYLGTCAPWRAQ